MGSLYDSEKTNLLRAASSAQRDGRVGMQEELRTTPLFSLLNKYSDLELVNAGIFPEHSFKQYSMLGLHDGSHGNISESEPILHNTRTPFSTFICGSQGSGKSHTLSCMLENCISPHPSYGTVGQRQAGLVLHYNAGSSSEPSETAGICQIGVPVRVYVAATNFTAMDQKYKALSGSAINLTVSPLYLKRNQLTLDMLRKMMAVNDGTGKTPLYMFVIQKILRDIAIEDQGKPFDYAKFRARVRDQAFSRDQSGPLEQRLDLLDGFLQPQKKNPGIFEHVTPGTLTIIDLSCPFIDPATARVLFDICVGLFKCCKATTGLVVALDEAHKFLEEGTSNSNSSSLTDQLLTTIREQRHNGVRVIIATQEPTISTKLLDLCTVCIVHRFTSPAWYSTISKHLVGARHSEGDQAALMDHIVELHVGQCLVFSPSSFVCTDLDNGTPVKLAATCFKMRVRRRNGLDLGMSKLADVEANQSAQTNCTTISRPCFGASNAETPAPFAFHP